MENNVSEEMKLRMDKVFTEEDPFKSPRPDDFGASFYKNYWAVVGEKVKKAILEMLNGGKLDR